MKVIRSTKQLPDLDLTRDLEGSDARGCGFWGVDLPSGARIRGLTIEQWQVPFVLRALGVIVYPDAGPEGRKALPPRPRSRRR